MGRAVYMSQISLWNYLLFEGFGRADDSEIMVLNLDVIDSFEESVRSVERSYYVYNPTEYPKSFKLIIDNLAKGKYKIMVRYPDGKEKHMSYKKSDFIDSKALMTGMPLNINSLEYMKIELEHEDSEILMTDIDSFKRARNKISFAYKLIREKILNGDPDSEILRQKQLFKNTMTEYKEANYQEATNSANKIVEGFEQ